MTREGSVTATVGAAVRRAGRFDRTLVSPTGGAIAAIPVVLVLGGGIIAGEPVAGVTMGAGAMLVGIAWRTRGGRAPLALMATDALLMAFATFIGCVTGSTGWLHLIVLGVLALNAGLLVALGPGGGVLGTQAVLAAVVFGRFNEPAASALGLAAYVLAGGAAQVVFVAVVRWPSALRVQRQLTATAFRALSELAARGEGARTLAAGAAIDEAQASLAAPTLLGDSALITLRALVGEAFRLRVQFAALQSLLRQQDEIGPAVTDALDRAAAHLALAADAIEGNRAASEQLLAAVRTPPAKSEPASTAADRQPAPPTDPAGAESPVALQLARRLAALGGQMRAVASLAQAAGEGGGLRSRRPLGRTTRPIDRVRSDLAALRANASLQSPAGRHAIRVCIVVIVAEVLARHIPLSRTYWMVVASATTLRPEFGATFTRGSERLLGTALGVLLAGLLSVALHPAGGVTVVLVGLLAWAAYSVFPASFAAGFGFITALVVFLLNVISPDTLATASARLLDTIVGGALGLIGYALWPTWGRRPARLALANLVAAQSAYAGGVFSAVIGGQRDPEPQLRGLSRSARLARTQAEAAVATSLSEPHTRRVDSDEARGALAATRRLVQALHVLRLDLEDEREPPRRPGLAPLQASLTGELAIVEEALRPTGRAGAAEVAGAAGGADASAALPDLRGVFEAWQRCAPAEAEDAAVVLALDEIVDATNSLGAALGLEHPAED